MSVLRSYPSLVALAFGCIVSLIAIGLLEVGCGIVEQSIETKAPQVNYSEPDFVQRDDLLGSRAKRNAKVIATRKDRDGNTIFSATYTTDAYGRRSTPVPASSVPKYFALFFGCSFIFGEGLNDDETLPAFFAALAPCYRAYNYGYIGYGPQQMPAILQSGRVPRRISERKGLLIYGYMGEPGVGHIDRAIGRMNIHGWARHFPYYHFGPEGNLIRSGSFQSGRPVRSAVYGAMKRSAIVRLFKLNHPLRINESHIRLTAKIIEESYRVFKKDFQSKAFYVVVFPGARRSTGKALIRYLQEAGIKCLDYGDLDEFAGKGYRIAGDEHPSAKWNKELAERIVRDLGLDAVCKKAPE